MTWERLANFSSSNVAEIAYDSSTFTLEVRFHNGSVYHYYDVPQHIWEDFKQADSKGQFIHQRIKGNYRYSRV